MGSREEDTARFFHNLYALKICGEKLNEKNK